MNTWIQFKEKEERGGRKRKNTSYCSSYSNPRY